MKHAINIIKVFNNNTNNVIIILKNLYYMKNILLKNNATFYKYWNKTKM